MNDVENQNNIELLIWMNGKPKEFSFKYKLLNISHISLTATGLKLLLSNYIFENQKIYNLLNLPKKAEFIQHLYTKNEAELEDSDIPHLKNNDILFFSLDILSVYKSSNNYYQYEFKKPIESGGFGKVFLAMEIATQNECAIKEISTENYSNEMLYNMSRECMILKEMSHKNIIKFHTFFTHNDNFYLVMDYARGGELSKLLEEKRKLSETEAKKIFKQIYNAVCYIHGKNIIHRDLKPNNILFLDEERTHIAIIDFGISGTANGNQREQIKAGTAKFLPPEMLSGKEYSSNTKLDIWALGVILYRMVEGCYPFEGKNNRKRLVIFIKVN
jgi:serine/threonine protein kinase